MTKTVTTGKATDLITFTRNSTGTYLDSVKYGDELVTNGDFSNGTTGWTASGNASLSINSGALRITTVTGGQTAYATTPLFLEVGKTYKYSVDNINTQGAGGMYLYLGSSAGSGSNVNVNIVSQAGTTTGTFVATHAITILTLLNGSQNQTGEYKEFDNISVKEVIGNQGTSGEPLLRTADTNEPRIEYDADGNLKGLLIEEQRTNDVTQSEDLTTWLKASGGAVIANQTIAPDGTKTANEMVGVVYKAPNIGSSTRAFSVFLKAKAGTTAQVRIDAPASQRIIVDLTDGSVTFSTGDSLDSYGVVDVGNGWYRCHIVVTDSITNYVITAEANDATHTIYAWGAQLETGSFPTSYIPTSGSTVTRNADVASINVSEFEYNTNEGSISMEIVPPSNNSGEQQWILGSNTNSARWAYSNESFDRAIAYDGTNTFNGEDLQPSTINKIATGTDQSTAAIYVNGESITGSATTNGNIASLTTIFYLGGNFSTGNVNLGGHIKSVKYYPVRLTDNQLKALTQ
jgi:hypothetical protein